MDRRSQCLAALFLAALLVGCASPSPTASLSPLPPLEPSLSPSQTPTIELGAPAVATTPTRFVDVSPTASSSADNRVYPGVLSLDGRVFDAIYSPDGKAIWLAYDSQGRLAVAKWDRSNAPDPASESDLEVTPTSCLARHATLSISSAQPLLAVSIGKSVLLVDTLSGEIVADRDRLARSASTFYARDLAFSSSGDRYALGENFVEIFDSADPDGYPRMLYLMKDPSARIFSGLEPEEARETGLSAAHVIEFSPDGSFLAVAGASFIGIWDAIAAYGFQFLEGYPFVQSISFAPDSQSLAFVTADGELYWWDISLIMDTVDIPAPRLIVARGVGLDASFSPDGEILAIGMSDGQIQLVDTSSFQIAHQVRAHASQVASVQFSEDGRELLSSSYDGSVKRSAISDLLSSPADREKPGASGAAEPTPGSERQLSLTSVHMVDESSGWAVDTDGRLLRTLDGAHHWEDVSPDDMTYASNGLFISDGSSAWVTPTIAPCYRSGCLFSEITEAVVWRTVDGGESWVTSQPFKLAGRGGDGQAAQYYQPASLQFVDPVNGWLLASVDHHMRRDSYRVFHSADGGNTWARMLDETNGPPLVTAFSLAFIDAEHGYLAGEGMQEYYDADHFYYTEDSGAHWDRIGLDDVVPWQTCGVESIALEALSPTVVSLDARLQMLEFRSAGCDVPLLESHALLADPTGALYGPWQETRTWNMSGTPYFINEELGWMLVIPEPGLTHTLHRTQNGGISWDLIRRVAWDEARFSFISERVGWAVVSIGEESALVRTVDGGESWHEIRPTLVESMPN